MWYYDLLSVIKQHGTNDYEKMLFVFILHLFIMKLVAQEENGK